MSITLERQTVTPKDMLYGEETNLEIVAGEYLQVRHGESGSPTTLLEEMCPAGKLWTVTVSVSIDETDV